MHSLPEKYVAKDRDCETALGFGFFAVLVLWVCSLGWGAHLGCEAYVATPAVEPFEAAVDPIVAKNVSKEAYLFSSMLFAVIFGTVWLLVPTRFLDYRSGPRGTNTPFGRVVGAVVFAWMMIFVTAINSSKAREKSDWATHAPSTGVVERVCEAIH